MRDLPHESLIQELKDALLKLPTEASRRALLDFSQFVNIHTAPKFKSQIKTQVDSFLKKSSIILPFVQSMDDCLSFKATDIQAIMLEVIDADPTVVSYWDFKPKDVADECANGITASLRCLARSSPNKYKQV